VRAEPTGSVTWRWRRTRTPPHTLGRRDIVRGVARRRQDIYTGVSQRRELWVIHVRHARAVRTAISPTTQRCTARGVLSVYTTKNTRRAVRTRCCACARYVHACRSLDRSAAGKQASITYIFSSFPRSQREPSIDNQHRITCMTVAGLFFLFFPIPRTWRASWNRPGLFFFHLARDFCSPISSRARPATGIVPARKLII
jgi:hypothetical protein